MVSIKTIYSRAFAVLRKKPFLLWGISLLAMLLSALSVPLLGVIPAASIAVSMLLQTAMTLIYLRGYRGEEIAVTQLFDTFKDWKTVKRVLCGIVASRSVRMAGDMFDQAIIAFIKRKYNLLIGERTAEQIKIEIGSAYALDPELTMEIKGRNLVDGLPKNIVVHSEDVRGALLECLVKITTAIKETLERTPPELSADIIDRGITLTGGGALLRGLDQLIQSETGIDVHIAEDPLDCVAKGAGAVLDHVDVLHDVLDTDGGHM